MDEDSLPPTFLQKAAAILGETSSALTGSKIVDAFNAYGEDWNVDVPHPEYPKWEAHSKRQAIYESLKVFSPQQQFVIIEELCEHPAFASGAPSKPERQKLKLQLYTKYRKFRPETNTKEVDLSLVEETRHWLESYPESLELFNEARLKYDHGNFERNMVDDLRLSLELLLRGLLNNKKRLEKQLEEVGPYLKSHNASPQVRNLFHKVLSWYTDFQNDYVKHDNKLKGEEVELIFEITSSLMKHLIRISTL